MNEFYRMITKNKRYSFSSVNSYVICPLQFKLSYIDAEERSGNFFSDYGLFCHNILEKYFKNELDIFELSKYYTDNYTSFVVSTPPPFPKGMGENYYNAGLIFFNNFEFNKEDYIIIQNEKETITKYNNVDIIIKPDLILKEKSTDKIFLLDFKTSDPFKKTGLDKIKIEEYKKQMLIYSYFINQESDIKIDKIKLWFIRPNKWYEFDYKEDEAGDAVNWFFYNIITIQVDDEFKPCDIEKNKYFCTQLCSVHSNCPAWK